GILLVDGVRNDERGRIIGRHDRDKRDRGLALVYAIVDDNFDDAVSRNRSVASRAEADRLQRRLVVGERSGVGERQGSGDRVVRETIPPGRTPDTASVSPASAFVSVMVAEAI